MHDNDINGINREGAARVSWLAEKAPGEVKTTPAFGRRAEHRDKLPLRISTGSLKRERWFEFGFAAYIIGKERYHGLRSSGKKLRD